MDNFLEQHRLSLILKPVFIGELILLDSLNLPGMKYFDGEFQIAIEEDEPITSEVIADYAKNYGKDIFVYPEDHQEITAKIKQEMTKLSRSLSIGNVQRNATKHANLLTMQMDSLYRDPFNDELLNNQFQNSRNLGNMLYNHSQIHKDLFHNISKSNYHYTVVQPLLSSILLLSFTQKLGGFNEKEIQNLFMTSYFKDIGMAFIPRDKFEKAKLDSFEKRLFAEHADNSMKILENRAPLTETQLSMIKNHHYLNYKIQAMITGKKVQNNSELLTGIESALLSSLDILVAMTHERPYRKGTSVFQALELLKKVLSDEYPQEFKALVIFLKKFYSN